MAVATRKIGLDILTDVPWGTHLCQFYKSKEDLTGILVPYFKAGLKNNEFCMWVTSEPLGVEDAKIALKKAVHDLDSYIAKGQIEIFDYSQWYTISGKFEADKVLQGWVEKEKQALGRGFDGLRLTGNNFWLEEGDWSDFADYEAMIDNVIGKHMMIAICTYPANKCGVSEVIDVVKNHQFALIRREDQWEVIESAGRKRAEDELRESEKKYRSLFDNMLDGFAYCKIVLNEDVQPIDFVYLEVNDAFERLTGLRREDVIGRKVTEAIPGIREAHPELFSIYGNVALTGAQTKFDIWFEPLEIWLTISVYSPHKGYFVAVFENITERKQAEDALRRSEENFRNSMDASPLGIRIITAEGELLYANQAILDMYSYSSIEELKAVPTKQRYTRESYAEHRERVKKRRRGQPIPSDYEISIVRKDGEVRHLAAHRRQVMWNGETQFQSLYEDITERKRAEDALRESEERYRQLVELSPDTIALHSEGKIEFINSAGVCLLGAQSKEQLIGKPIFDFLHPDYCKVVLHRIREAKQKTRQAAMMEEKFIRMDGTLVDVEVAAIPLTYRGRPAMQAVVRDITERKQAEEELRKHRDHLEELVKERTAELETVNEELQQEISERKQMQEKLLVAERLATLGELSGSISHELRNPLGVIDSSAYYLKTKLKGADVKVQQHLHRIRSSVDSATGIIESLLNLTRMKAPQAERLNLIAIASDAIVISEVPATLKVIQDFAEHEVWVNADRGQLHMAFKNIVTNAVQAMDGEGTLTVTVRKTADGEAEISFTDTGPGIAAENLDKVFQPLFSTKARGIGFGLSIAKMIIDKHGGTIEAKFEPGKGATIIIRLPPYVNKGKGA